MESVREMGTLLLKELCHIYIPWLISMDLLGKLCMNTVAEPRHYRITGKQSKWLKVIIIIIDLNTLFISTD